MKEIIIMSLVTQARKTLNKTTLKEAFKNQSGAIDLASIMVGIIVIGLIGGVIAATVFAVIPWAQDNAAKQQLDNVASAQSAYLGLSADKGVTQFGGAKVNETYESGVLVPDSSVVDDVVKARKVGGAGDAIVTDSLFNGGTNVATAWYGTGKDAHYAAAAKSSSGKVFYITDTKTQPTENAGANAATGWVTAVTKAVTP